MKPKRKFEGRRVLIASRNDIRFFRWRFIRWEEDGGDLRWWTVLRMKEYHGCSAHGQVNCCSCSLNNGQAMCDDCSTFDAWGVHWDTCAKRMRLACHRRRCTRCRAS